MTSAAGRIAPRPYVLMVTLCGAQVIEVLGVTAVIVALPVIGADLALTDGQLQLVVTLYAVLYGSLLLTAGRLADRFDRRAAFAAGLVLTGLGALVCAGANSGGVLLAGRAVQGVGGAVVTPAALALLTSNFPGGRGRRVAVSAWTAAAAGGGALGFALGGLLVDAAGWRSLFWVLAGLAATVLVVHRLAVPRPAAAAVRPGFDVLGSLTVTTGLVVVVWGAGLAAERRPALPPWLVLGTGLSLLALFVAVERRSSAALLDWAELTNRPFMTANAAAFVNTATTSAAGTLVALVAQRLLGLDARTTGLVLLPFSVAVVVGSTTGSWWLRRPARRGMAVGLVVVAAGMTAFAGATWAGSVLGLAAACVVAGLGLSWVAVASTSAATQALPAARQGVAAGAVNTAAQVGTALGVAGLLTVATLAGDGADGYVTAFLAAAALAGTAAAVISRSSRQAEPNTQLE